MLEIFCEKIFFCKANRCNCVLNVGKLIAILPQWQNVQLSGKWCRFWDEARKLAIAVVKQPSIESRQAVLAALRQKALAIEATTGHGWERLFQPPVES